MLDRLIANNIILAFKVFHTMNNNNSRNKGYVGYKLDMIKEYDRLE